MLAITISCPSSLTRPSLTPLARSSQRNCYAILAVWSAIVLALLQSLPIFAQIPASESEARRLYDEARQEFAKAETNTVAGWRLGRAAFNLSEFAHDEETRTKIAEAGIAGCQHTLALQPKSASAHYYLGLNLGQVARAKKLSALRVLREMEQEFLQALDLDPELDRAGPDRALGMLYMEAPIWPASIGNRSKARIHFESAVKVSPEFPENHLCLAEALARWGEVQSLEHQLHTLEDVFATARARFPLPQWAGDWADWESRLQKLRKARERLNSSKRVSPSERGARPAK